MVFFPFLLKIIFTTAWYILRGKDDYSVEQAKKWFIQLIVVILMRFPNRDKEVPKDKKTNKSRDAPGHASWICKTDVARTDLKMKVKHGNYGQANESQRLII